MTLEELEHYRGMIVELKALQKQKEDLYNTYHSPSMSSSGSFSGASISPVEQALIKIDRLETIYQIKIEALKDKTLEVEEWLSTIEDNYVRSCIRYHYLLGYTWKETTKEVYGDYYSDHNSRMVVKRYMNNKMLRGNFNGNE